MSDIATQETKDSPPTSSYGAKELFREHVFTGCCPNVVNTSFNGLNISYLSRSTVLNTISKHPEVNTKINEAEKNHSDLIPGEYEGGLKIWECTNDLAQFIVGEGDLVAGEDVLDLGCGAGILGIISLKLGAQSVTFQDYNEEVLKYWTMRNVALNECKEPTRYWCGDWENFASKVSSTFNVILSSETIYNPESHEKILHVLENTLKPTGVMYIAGKSYYFGVGGSVNQFKELIESTGKFSCRSVWKSCRGVSREILAIKWITTD